MPEKNRISYIRVSTEEQKKMGYSLEHQSMVMGKYCEIRNGKLLKEFADNHSAKTFDRPEWNKLMAYVKANKNIVDEIIFLRWDRFSRNIKEALEIIAELRKYGVTVNAVEQPLDLDNCEAKIMLSLYLSIGEVENDKNSIRTTEATRKAKLEGCWMGSAPLGYDNYRIGKHATLIPNEKAVHVKKAFQEVTKNVYSIDEVRKQMIAKKEITLSKQAFLNMLRNIVYIGKIFVSEYKKEASIIVKGQHEALISDAVFYSVQEVLAGKKKKYISKRSIDEIVYLRNHLLCPKCGRKMTGSLSTNGSKTAKIGYYHCQYNCKGVRFRVDQGHILFGDFIKEIKIHPAAAEIYLEMMKSIFKEKEGDRIKDKAALEKKINRLETLITNIEDKYAEKELAIDQYQKFIDRYTKDIADLKWEVAELTNTDNNYLKYVRAGISLLLNVDVYLNESMVEEKSKIIRSIFPEKLVFENGQFRTIRENELISQISNVYKGFKGSKIEKVDKNVDQSTLAPPARLERATL